MGRHSRMNDIQKNIQALWHLRQEGVVSLGQPWMHDGNVVQADPEMKAAYETFVKKCQSVADRRIAALTKEYNALDAE